MTRDAANGTPRAQSIRSKLADTANAQITEQKNRLVSRAGDLLQAVRQTAEQLREPSPAMAGYVDRAADRLDQWVTTVRDRDAAELLDDMRGFARERPALVVGGGFALGLLAARFLKSSGRRGSDRDYPETYRDYPDTYGREDTFS